ncbi:hypothetical protein [Desulfatitalea alkaliphila]|uniref:Uncharacterized protein n=1 Tax=Desulfatitalea alkaliphila TaxID=2929485 RepID=A0AA41R775_9BACT|nr:hypothetical protein [Desulfatitalea alkaliphila]MCJ8502490.1 hypothetical protein [Desulfatitalea alkaliphila]
MKPEQLYRELKELAEKLDIRVLEQNFRPTGIHVKSGYCKVKDKDHCIIDKHLRLNQKVEVLAECLAGLPIESIYIVPAAREYLDRFKPQEFNSDDTVPNRQD